MMLFHGTTTKLKSPILRHGLRSRKLHKKDVYSKDDPKLASDLDRIYLTDCLAPQFASISRESLGGGNILILGVIVDPEDLLPDTDFPRAGTYEECLKRHGTCSMKADRLSVDRAWVLRYTDALDAYGDRLFELPSGLQHIAEKKSLVNLQEWCLQLSEEIEII